MNQTCMQQFSIKGIPMVGNSNTGAIIGLTRDGSRLIELLEENDNIDEKLLSEEQRLLLQVLQSEGFLEPLMPFEGNVDSAYVHVTQRCNLNCIGCYSHDHNRNKADDMGYEQICIVLRKLKILGCKTVIISGGEPFLRKDIYDILKFAKERQKIQQIRVITNGALLNYNLNMIKEYVDEVNISIDGYDKEHPTFIRDQGIYETVINNIRLMQKTGINVCLIATLHKRNIDKIAEYLNLSQELHVRVTFSILTDAGDFDQFDEWAPTEEQLIMYATGKLGNTAELYARAEPTDFIVQFKKGCGFAKGLISIDYEGNVKPCHMSHTAELSLGNIITDSVDFIKRVRIEKFGGLEVDKINECKGCEYKYVCGGGCRARALNTYNDSYEKDPYCSFNYAYFEMIFSGLVHSYL